MPSQKSSEQLHRNFLKKEKKVTAQVVTTQSIILILFIAVWEIASRQKWVDPLIFSYPSKILAYLVSAFQDGSIYSHLGVTVLESVVGFILGTGVGILIATIIWWLPFWARVIDPFLVVLNSMPKVALGPILIVMLGPGLQSIIMITLLVTVIITTINIYNRFRETEQGYLKVVQTFGASRLQQFKYVVLPSAIPAMISALKVNVGLSWIGVIVGEFLVAKEGLGYLIIYGFQVFNFTLVLSTLFIIAFVATIMYQAVALFEKKITQGWREQ